MAEGPLNALDSFIIDKTGTKMGVLYEDVIEQYTSGLKEQYELQKAKRENRHKMACPAPAIENPPKLELRIQQPRQKDKTRLPRFSNYNLIPQITTTEPAVASCEATDNIQTQVRRLCHIKTIFSKAQGQGAGSITWAPFESVMADLQFSVMRKYGSVYNLYPSKKLAGMEGQRPITLHRPQDRGSRVIYYSSLRGG